MRVSRYSDWGLVESWPALLHYTRRCNFDDVARDPRYGWKVTLLVLLAGLCLGASMGLPGMLVGLLATVIAWLVLSSACSMYGSIPFAACARTIGMGFYPLLLAGYEGMKKRAENIPG